MVITKKEYGASDAAPHVMYAKRDGSSQIAYPMTAGMFNPGFAIPEYDSIAISYVAAGTNGTGEIHNVVYSYSGSTVATLTLGYDASSNLTSVVES